MSDAPSASRRQLYVTAAALLGLLAVTFGAHYLPLPSGVGLAVALTVSTAKMVLIVLVFMHVKGGSRLLRVFVGAGLVWLVLLFTLTLADYLTRGWLPAP